MNYEGGQMSQISEQNDEIDLKELFAAIWHNWWIVLTSAVIVAVLAGYYAFAVATPLYKASTRFELLDDDAGGSMLGSAAGLAALAGISVKGSASESEALQDRILSRPFVDSIYDKANFIEDAFYNNSLREPGVIQSIEALILGQVEPKSIARNDYLVMAIDALQESLKVIPNENGIIELTILHPDPQRASEIANIIVDRSLFDIFERERKSTRDSLNYFADQLLEVRADLDAASAAVRDYAISNNIQSKQELARTSSQLAQVRREIEVLEKSILALDEIGDGKFDGSAFAQSNPVSASLSFRRLLNLSGDPSDWVKPSSRDIEVAKERLEAQKETLIVSFNAIEARAKSSGAEALELSALQREVEVQQAIYETVITQFEARSLTSGYEKASGRLVEQAIPPIFAWSPNKKLVVAFGLILGVFVGIGLCLIYARKLGAIYTFSAFKGALHKGDTRRFKKSDFGKLDAKRLDRKRLVVAQDILVSHGDGERVFSIFATTPGTIAMRVALSLSKASSEMGARTACLDFSNEVIDAKLNFQNTTRSGVFTKTPLSDELVLLTPEETSILLKVSEAKTQLEILKKEYDRIFVVLPSPDTETAISQITIKLVDAAIIVAESARTNRNVLDSISRILDKSQISEPLLVVT